LSDFSFTDSNGQESGGGIAKTKLRKEKKLADFLANSLDSLSFDPDWVVFSMHDKGTAINLRLFDLIMAFLNNWSNRYRDNEVRPGMKMYTACEMAYRMTSSLSATKE